MVCGMHLSENLANDEKKKKKKKKSHAKGDLQHCA